MFASLCISFQLPSLTILDTQALNLLLGVLAGGAHAKHEYAVITATPPFLSLLATFVVHPTLTTRAKSLDRLNLATMSLRYLRALIQAVGPIQSRLHEAVSFGSASAGTRSGVSRKRTKDLEQSDGAEANIENDLATTGSLWNRAQDFWHVVGWAFNCSVKYKRRWDFWTPWLDFMLEALERDFCQRDRQDKDAMAKSLLMRFIKDTRGGRAERRILRAIFSNGRDVSMNEFPEVWPNETKGLKKAEAVVRKAPKLDVEADEYGDYQADEHEDELSSHSEESESGSQPPSATETASDIPNGAERLGGLESLHLRLRFLSLLFGISCDLPDSFMSFVDLSESFYDQTRELPLDTFFLLMSASSTAFFETATNVSNLQYFLSTNREGNAPGAPNDRLTQEVLEKYYLPWAANSTNITDNTKYSLCVEALLRLAMREGMMLRWTPDLQEAVEQGMQRRREKCSSKGRRRKKASGRPEMMWLDASEERIKLTLQMIPREEYESQDAELTYVNDVPILSIQGTPIKTPLKRRPSLHQISQASPLREKIARSRDEVRTPSKRTRMGEAQSTPQTPRTPPSQRKSPRFVKSTPKRTSRSKKDVQSPQYASHNTPTPQDAG